MRRKNQSQQLDLFTVSACKPTRVDLETGVVRADISFDLQQIETSRRRTKQAIQMWHLFGACRRPTALA